MEDTNVGIVASKPLFPASTIMSPHLHASTPATHVSRPASPPGSIGFEGVPEGRYGPGGEDAQHAPPGPSMPSRSPDCPRVRMYVDLQLAPLRPTDPPCSMISDSPQEENINDLMQNGLDKSVPALTDGQALPSVATTSSSVTLGSCQPHCGRGPTRVYLGTQDNGGEWQSEATPAGVTVSVGQAKEDPCVKLLEELLDCSGETGTGAEPNEEPGIIENPGESLHLSHIHCHFLDDLLDGINRGAIQNDQSTSAAQENQTTTPTPQEEQKDEEVAASLQRQQTRPTSELIQELAEEDGSEQQDPTSPLPAQVMQQEPFQLSHDVKLQDTTSLQHDLHIKDTTDLEEVKATPLPQAVLDVPLQDPSSPLAVHNTPLLDTQGHEEPLQTTHEGNKQETLPLEVVSGVPNECVAESHTQTLNPPSKLQVEASQADEGEPPPPPSGHDQVDEVVPTLPISSDGGVSGSTVTGIGRQEDDTTQPSPSIHTSPDPIPLQELEVVSLEAASQEPENQETTSVSDQGNHRPGNSEMPLASTESGCDEDEDDERRSGLAAAVSRVVRRSMRRMRRFRLSGRGAPQATGGSEEGDMSEETQIRRGLPNAPPLGLSTVRSPAAASIIVSSLMAALSPPPITGPRETLPPLGASDDVMMGGPEGRRWREGRPPQDALTPTPPMSLEVEVGGYNPNTPTAGDQSWGATFIPRPSFLPLHTSPSPNSPTQQTPSSPTPNTASSPTHHTPTTPSLASPSPLTSLVGETERGRDRRGEGEEGRRDRRAERGEEGRIDRRGGVVMEGAEEARRERRERGGSEGGGARERHQRRASRDRTEHVTTPTLAAASNNNNNNNSTDSINSILTNTRSNTTATTTARNSTTSPSSPANNSTTSTTAAATNEERTNSTTEINNNSNTSNNRNRRRASNSTNNTTTNRRGGQRHGRNGRGSSASTSSRPHLGVSVGVGCARAGAWNHSHSGLMASLAVTLTTFNISRFAVLGARFGWPFVVQWCVVSAVLGLPLMTFHVTLGQYLGAGVVDMWVLSPVFQGVGYSILLAQGLLGLYCCVPIAWLFIFFRDSFITHNNMFLWTDCRLINCSIYNNFTTIIIEGVPKYFNSQVLQREEGSGTASFLQDLGTLKFDMAFNIALIWIITLLALSRGNQWYGKVCYVAVLVPLLCYLVVCLYLAADTKDDLYINDVTNFSEFFMNSRSWMAASREVFLVWGLHSAVLQQMAAHNKRGHALYRDTTVLWVVTSLALVLAAVTGSSCVAGLHHNGLQYKPSSFETTESAQFLREATDEDYFGRETLKWTTRRSRIPPSPRPEHLHHDNFYTGIRIRPPPYPSRLRRLEGDEESGYQSLRLATELFPALLAVNGAKKVSPFWSSLFYLSLLLFGIAQQLAVWRTVVEAVISLRRERLQGWETFITFLCCLFGFSAALPMATGAGIHILYFLDYVVSCGWWLMIIQLVQIFALLFVRGKPYSGQDIVSELLGRDGGCGWLWLGPLTSFSWNIIVPVGLLVLSISSFKSGHYREVFTWGGEGSYWPVWACQLAAALQLLPILLVPLVGLIQTCRYLAASDDDLFDRIQRLYRPTLRSPYAHGRHAFLTPTDSDSGSGRGGEGQDEAGDTHLPRPYSDPPPKYTPPPSYSTATGARLAKLVNQSVRQSMRRLRASFRSPTAPTTTSPATPATDLEAGQQQVGEQRSGGTSQPYIPPPDYLTATECGSSSSSDPPQYATLDPLRRQRALAVLAGVSGVKVEDQGNGEGSVVTGLQRNTSLRGSGLGRSLASGVRRSARRLAATLGMGTGEDGAALVVSEATPAQGANSGHTQDDQQPYVYTNIELVSHSYA